MPEERGGSPGTPTEHEIVRPRILHVSCPTTRVERSARGETEATLKIKLTSVPVDDQHRALNFYTGVLGFIKKRDIPSIKWLTLVSPEEPDGTELLLEPADNPATKAYKSAFVKQEDPVDGLCGWGRQEGVGRG